MFTVASFVALFRQQIGREGENSASRRYRDRVIDLVKLQPAVGRRPSRYKLPPDKQVDGARDETRRC